MLSTTRRLALNNRGLLNTACQPHKRCTLNWVRQRGREGATKDGGWEGGKKGRVGEGGSKGMERGSNDAREGGSGSIGREGGLRKGTSEEGTELCMYGARGRGEGGSERRRGEQRREVDGLHTEGQRRIFGPHCRT